MNDNYDDGDDDHTDHVDDYDDGTHVHHSVASLLFSLAQTMSKPTSEVNVSFSGLTRESLCSQYVGEDLVLPIQQAA